jgi:hypothetical protein
MCQGSVPRVPRIDAVRTERHSAQAYTVSIKNSAEGPGKSGALAEFFSFASESGEIVLYQQVRKGVILTCAESEPLKVRILYTLPRRFH